jgi:CHAT domain
MRLVRCALLAGALLATPAAGVAQEAPPSAEDFRRRAEAIEPVYPSAAAMTLADEIARRTWTARDQTEWASLTLSLAIAYTHIYNAERSRDIDPADHVRFYDALLGDAHKTLDSVLTVLTRESSPLEWARAQEQRANIYRAYEAAGNDPGRIEPMQAAERAALSIFTLDAHPRDYFRIRCSQLRREPPDPTTTSTLAYATQRYDVKDIVLTSACESLRGFRFADTNRLNRNREDVIRWAANYLIYPINGPLSEDEARARGGRDLADQLDLGRAALLSASLSLRLTGMTDEQIARANRLRARADQLEMQATSEEEWLNNAEFWRLRAEVFDTISSAAFPERTQSMDIDLPVLAPVILGPGEGLVAARPVSGNGVVLPTSREWLSRIDMRQDAYAPPSDRILAARRAAGNFATLEQQEMTPAEQQAAAEMGPASWAAWQRSVREFTRPRAMEHWAPLYAAGDYRGAIREFRAQFEPAWSRTLRGAIVQSGVEPDGRILVMPDGAASALPIGLLRDASSGRTLIEDYEIIFTPSLSTYRGAQERARNTGSRRIAVIGIETPSLPFAPVEARMVRRAFGRATETGSDTLMSGLRDASYWHFATHGSFDWENPRNSGLVLPGGGRLSVGELYTADAALGAPRLVVLSACETGLFDSGRDPDQFVGLATGFIQAGAAGVIASLWPVPDISTTLLMAKFYDLHLRRNERPSQALRHAQLWLRGASHAELAAFAEELKARRTINDTDLESLLGAIAEAQGERPFDDPYYWGAWVFYGT